jgi:O-antigen ligase
MELYLFLMLCVIPCFWYGAANGSHDYLAILFSAVVWGYWLITGVPYHPLLYGIMLWLIMSVAWSTHSGNSIDDLLMILAMITVVFASQGVDKFLLMFFSFAPAAGMAGLEIYQLYYNKPAERGAFFGNTNHSGIYYAINFFIGLWISYNISLLFLPFCILILWGIICTRCRAAILAVCVGMGVVLFKEVGNVATIIICSLIGVFTIVTQRPLKHMQMAFNSRGNIFIKTIKMIIEKPIWGWGLGTFRKEHQGRLPAMPTHRVHNDILEILFEVGIIGLALITWFFFTLAWNDPFISAALVAGIVSSCFFFTFRESHTAAPLMILCGLSLPPIGMVSIPYLISGILLMGMLYIIWVCVIRKVIALTWYANGGNYKEKKEQMYCVEKAVGWHPSTEYIARLAFYYNTFDRGKSYDIASRMIYNYDGRVVLWEAYDQLARAAWGIGAINLAQYFNKKGLESNPDFVRGHEFKASIENLFKELKESNHGTVEMR